MPGFADLVRQVFERKGFAVELGPTLRGDSGAAYEVPLLASHGDERVLVMWKLDSGVSVEDVRALAFAVPDAHASAAVVIGLGGANAAAAPSTPVEVWSFPRLVAEVGEAVLHDALAAEGHGDVPSAALAEPAPAAPAVSATPVSSGGKRFPSLIAQAATATASPQRDPNVYMYKSKPKAAGPDPQDGHPLNYAWGASAAAASSPTPKGIAMVQKGAPRKAQPSATIVPEHDDVEIISSPRRGAPTASGPAPAAPVSPPPAPSAAPLPQERAPTPPPPPAPKWQGPPAPPQTCAVRLDREKAVAAASGRVGAVKSVELQLVPHIAFDFDAFVTHKQLPEPITGAGAVYVNAITGQIHQGEMVSFSPTLPEAATPAPAAKLSAVDIYDKVKSHLGKQFSREMQVSREIGGNEVYENLKITPGITDLGLNHRGVVNAAVWVVTGSTGTVRVDATTGAILE